MRSSTSFTSLQRGGRGGIVRWSDDCSEWRSRPHWGHNGDDGSSLDFALWYVIDTSSVFRIVPARPLKSNVLTHRQHGTVTVQVARPSTQRAAGVVTPKPAPRDPYPDRALTMT